jgi:hypothetical protein
MLITVGPVAVGADGAALAGEDAADGFAVGAGWMAAAERFDDPPPQAARIMAAAASSGIAARAVR